MSYFELFNINEYSETDFSNSLLFKFEKSVKKTFFLDINNLNLNILNSNPSIIWIINNPFISDKVYKTSNFLDIVSYDFDYAGVYEIHCIIKCNESLLHIQNNVNIIENLEPFSLVPKPSLYFSTQNVSLNCYDRQARIYYTLDDSDPKNSESTQLYVNPIEISKTTNIKYYCLFSNGNISDVYDAEYVIQEQTGLIEIYPQEQNFQENIEVEFIYDLNEISKIYYKTSGSDYQLYTNAFTVDKSTVVTFYGVNKLNSQYPEQTKYYYVDKVQPTITFNPVQGTYYNSLNISLTPNKPGCIISYSVSGNPETEYSGLIDVVDMFGIQPNYHVYNIPFYAKIVDSFARETEYNINYNLTIDYNAPIITLVESPPNPAVGSTFLFKFTVQGNPIGENVTAYTYFSVNSKDWEEYGLCKEGIIYQYYIFGVQKGLNSIKFKAVDNALNETIQEFIWEVI